MDYNIYWKKRGHSGYKERYGIIDSWVERGASVLDIGCGDGAALEYLVKTKSIVPFGIELSSQAAQMAKRRKIPVKVQDITIPNFKLDRKYDFIVMSEVLEHIPNPEQVLMKLVGHFKKGLIVTIPNIGLYEHRLRLFLGRFPVQWVQHPGEHLRFWSISDFRWWCDKMKLQIIRQEASNGVRLLHIYRWWPSLFGNQIVFFLNK